jgi:hypothetical protein
MDKKLSKILMIIVLVLAVIGIVLYYFTTAIDIPAEDAPGYDAAKLLESTKVGAFVSYGLILLVIVTVVTLALSLLNLLKKPALLKKALLGVGVMLVLFAIAYFTSNGDEVLDASGNIFVDSDKVPYVASTYKYVATAIQYSVILLIVGGGLFVYDMVKNLVK